MTINSSRKLFAFAGISMITAGGVALLNTGGQGVLWERKKSDAAVQEAVASNGMVVATTLDANNRLEGTVQTALATITAAQTEAAATRAAAQQNAAAMIAAAQKQADALVAATAESVRAENQQFDQVTAPLFSQPTERMAQLNAEIVRLKHEAQAGRDTGTKIVRLPSGRFEEVSILAEREAELEMLKEATAKNWSDLMGMVTGAISGGLGDMGKLYPTGNEPAPARRFIVPEQ